MTGKNCERTCELLPEWREGVLDSRQAGEVEQHLEACRDCREELAVIDALLEVRPEPPQDLATRIQARVREEMGRSAARGLPQRSAPPRRFSSLFRPARWNPAWALSAAAVAALALGWGVLGGPDIPTVEEDTIVVASQEALPEAWLWDDGMVAGAPVFDDLTDEELEALIKEFEG